MIYQRLAFRLDRDRLTVTWGDRASTSGGAPLPVLLPTEPCDETAVLCYDNHLGSRPHDWLTCLTTESSGFPSSPRQGVGPKPGGFSKGRGKTHGCPAPNSRNLNSSAFRSVPPFRSRELSDCEGWRPSHPSFLRQGCDGERGTFEQLTHRGRPGLDVQAESTLNGAATAVDTPDIAG